MGMNRQDVDAQYSRVIKDHFQNFPGLEITNIKLQDFAGSVETLS